MFPVMRVHSALPRIYADAGRLQLDTVVPGHPVRRITDQFRAVPLQLIQVIERVGPTKFAGVNQAHEQIADTSPILGLVEQRVLAMQDGFLQHAF